ncbi:MAG TPA: hypothetical protein VFZ09_02060 [Archangium sp.]|uniref:hypothetical protein n=1 Tax=Archangium sp. TaxID=1872627 RepID=UPI002E3172F0|nr:hypothetical protein [Archangium sp.]HEX5744995.1 hypothetical protein [Archangium sp.]
MHRMLLIAVAAVLGTGCGAGMEDATGLSSEELGTHPAELAALEYNEASASVDVSYDIVNFVYAPDMFPGEVGRGGYQAYGDKIGLADYYSDGMRIGVHWRLGDGSRRGLCYWTGGANTHGGCNKDFGEGKRFEFRVGRCNGSKYSCGDPAQSGTGWQDWSNWASTGT